MTLSDLEQILKKHEEQLSDSEKTELAEKLKLKMEAYPFNVYELRLSFLKEKNRLTFEEYETIRKDYITSNKYLELYGLAPRIFGEIWGEEHIRSIDGRFLKASKALDKNYDGEYDLWLDGVKIEVKSCRAIDSEIRGSLSSKALHSNEDRKFWMNFQQLKPDSCDYFIFIGVWVDTIQYWVLTAEEVKKNPYISHQHRDGIEYQIGITHKNITEFNKYLKKSNEIAGYILESSRK
jgi:hypothetical protein